MHRLVIALTTLLALTGAAVVGAYLFLFSGSTDRAATFVAPDAIAYANVYLEPSAGQRMNLAALLGHFPGFGDEATLDEKVDEVVQRLLGDAGVDYRADVKPWLGGQVAVAVSSAAEGDPAVPDVLVLAAVADVPQAEAALGRLASRDGTIATTETHAGVTLHVADGGATYAIDDEIALLGSTAADVRAAIDRHADGATLAAESAFTDAMRSLPADHLASIYVNLARAAALGGAPDGALGDLTVASAALLAAPNGLHLAGSAPFGAAATDAAGPSANPAPEASALSDWMPLETQASAVVFGLRDIVLDLERAATSVPEVSQALTQLRALAALGLGINIDDDLLPLLDREAAVALTGLGESPGGVLVLHPSDAGAAADAMERVAGALESRGFARSVDELGEVSVTTLDVPQVGRVSYATLEDVVLVALEPDAIAAAIDAHVSGSTLATSDAYRATFDLAGARGDYEIYADLGSLLGLLDGLVELDAETRAILEPIHTLGITAQPGDRDLDFDAAVTVE